jgi:hypothetical protein
MRKGWSGSKQNNISIMNRPRRGAKPMQIMNVSKELIV